MKKWVLFFCCLWCVASQASSLYESKAESPYRFYYQINNEEARLFYSQKNSSESVYKMLHSKVDSIPVTSKVDPLLPIGHYLKVWTEADMVRVQLHTVQEVYPYIMQNGQDLMVRVLDTLGNNVSNASVYVGKKELKYDKKKLCYYLYKKKMEGLLVVRYNTLDIFSALHSRKMVGYEPISIKKKGNKEELHLFAVTNKPKYRPQDTVRYKLYLTEGEGRNLVSDSINVYVAQSTKKYISTITPYMPGFYEGYFVLEDSLDLRLDRVCNIIVQRKGNKRATASCYGLFKYEDYELKSLNMEVRMDNHKQYRGDSLVFFVEGTDENELPIQDGRLEISVIANLHSVEPIFRNTNFPSEPLYKLETKLDPRGEMRIAIPWECMPAANFNYDVKIKMLTTDNQVRQESQNVEYVYRNLKITSETKKDSIRFLYSIDDKASKATAAIYGYTKEGNVALEKSVELPKSFKIDPFIEKYKVVVGNKTEIFNMSSVDDSLEIKDARTGKAVAFEISNPRKIPFNYFIYKQDKLMKSGVGLDFRFKTRDGLNDNYFVSIQYLWGGTMREREIPSYSIKGNALQLTVKQDPIVYPGKATNIEITATRKGKPMKGVDITAYANTAKFNSSLPYDFPEMGYEKLEARKRLVQYQLDHIHLYNRLDYTMNRLDTVFFGKIDTIERYKFLYPDTIYTHTIPSMQSQIAPFIVFEGKIQPVHVIYIDAQPSYISFVTNKQPYSVFVFPGKHSVWVRTSEYMFDLGDVTVEPNSKLILSVNQKKFENKVQYGPVLTETEKKELLSYLMPIRGQKRENYIMQNENVFDLSRGMWYGTHTIIGPVKPIEVAYVEGEKRNSFQFVPKRLYDFSKPDMQTSEYDMSSYKKFERTPAQNITDSVLTVASLWKTILNEKRETRDYARRGMSRTYRSKADTSAVGYLHPMLTFKNAKDSILKPLNYVILTENDSIVKRFESVYSYNIQPIAPGKYLLYALFRNNEYAVTPITIMENQHTFVSDTIQTQAPSLRSSVYNRFADMLAQTLPKNTPMGYAAELQQINAPLNETSALLDILSAEKDTLFVPNTNIGAWVKDKKGNAIVGAKVAICDYKIYSRSDFSGFVNLQLNNYDGVTLHVEAAGMRPKRILLLPQKKVSASDNINIVLSPNYPNWSEYEKPEFFVFKNDTISLDKDEVVFCCVENAYNAPRLMKNTDADTKIRVRGSGMAEMQNPLYIVDGKVVESIADIKSSDIRQMDEMKDSRARALYGAKAAGGVIVVTTKKKKSTLPNIDDRFIDEAMDNSSMRSNFSDYAFWMPKLKTDKDGKASFSFIYPDDATRWNTFFLGIKDNKYSATFTESIRAFKPLMAKISVPRFMVENDSIRVVAQANNYLSTTEKLNASFWKEGEQIDKKKITLKANSGRSDSLWVHTLSLDSLTVGYKIEREDGYFDGEERKIPVYKKGIEIVEGECFTLASDSSTLDCTMPHGKTSVTLYANEFDVIKEEIKTVKNYDFLCNEQKASKIIAMLTLEKIQKQSGEKFKYRKDVKKLISALIADQNEDGTWGWWKGNSGEDWITLHVIKALLMAKEMGYKVNLKISVTDLSVTYARKLYNITNPKYLLDILEALYQLEATVDYTSQFKRLDQLKTEKEFYFSAVDELREIRLKQLVKQPYDLKILSKYKSETMLGNEFYSNHESTPFFRKIWNSDIKMTLLAYQILRDSYASEERLAKIRSYFYEKRGVTAGWGNTYVSSKIIDVIAPDIKNQTEEAPRVIIGSAIDTTVTTFPTTIKYLGGRVNMLKRGKLPVFVSVEQRHWEREPKEKQNSFTIQTKWEEEFKAGKTTRLQTKIEVKKEADFVRIEIPIPAGCSYDKKYQRCGFFSHEVHREFFKNKLVIYCRNLPEGNYTFDVDLMPRYSGIYTINPARVELMYFPAMNANNEIKRIEIK